MADYDGTEDRIRTRLQRLDRHGWHVIASRARVPEPMKVLVWWQDEKAIGEARSYAKRGFLFVANRHYPDRVELVAKPSSKVFAPAPD
jgi:hypothetical protein